MARWDWYQATLQGVRPDIVADRFRHLADLSSVRPAKGMHGYTSGAEVHRGDHVLARIWWCDHDPRMGVHVQGTGDDSPLVRRALEAWPDHRPSRVDACEDWTGDAGLFDRLAPRLVAYAKETGLAINQMGDWERGKARTLYLGAKSSAVQLVLYEKGHQLGPLVDQTWVRLEVRVRPAKHARAQVAAWVPGDAFRAGWVPQALERIGWDHLERIAVGTQWRPSDQDRARAALVAQYGRTIQEWAEEVGGWEAIGDVLRGLIVDGAGAGEPGGGPLAGSGAPAPLDASVPTQHDAVSTDTMEAGNGAAANADRNGDRAADGATGAVRGEAAAGWPGPGRGVGPGHGGSSPGSARPGAAVAAGGEFGGVTGAYPILSPPGGHRAASQEGQDGHTDVRVKGAPPARDRSHAQPRADHAPPAVTHARSLGGVVEHGEHGEDPPLDAAAAPQAPMRPRNHVPRDAQRRAP